MAINLASLYQGTQIKRASTFVIVGQFSDVRGIVGRDSVIARVLRGEISPRNVPDVRISPDNAPNVQISPKGVQRAPSRRQHSHGDAHATKNDPHRIPMRVVLPSVRVAGATQQQPRSQPQQRGPRSRREPERPPPQPSWRPRQRTWQHAWPSRQPWPRARRLLGSGLLGGF